MSKYDGQSFEGMILLDGEVEDLLFREKDSRDAHRFLSEGAHEHSDPTRLLGRLSTLALEGKSHRAQYLLGQIAKSLPVGAEWTDVYVSEVLPRDASGLAMNYDAAVGMIHRVQDQVKNNN